MFLDVVQHGSRQHVPAGVSALSGQALAHLGRARVEFRRAGQDPGAQLREKIRRPYRTQQVRVRFGAGPGIDQKTVFADKTFRLVPQMQLVQRIRSDHPHEMLRRIPPFQDIQRVDRVGRAGPFRLQLAHAHPRMPRDRRAEHRHAVGKRGRFVSGLVGRMRSGKEDDPVHTASFQQILREADMSGMNGVERAAENGCQLVIFHSDSFVRGSFVRERHMRACIPANLRYCKCII